MTGLSARQALELPRAIPGDGEWSKLGQARVAIT
jgi:hypothetical protein